MIAVDDGCHVTVRADIGELKHACWNANFPCQTAPPLCDKGLEVELKKYQ
jgi:hypothetical protein